MELMLVVIAVLQAYVLGSINFAVIISKLFANKDVRNFGSGNAGMTNVMRVFGVLPAIITFLLDVFKGFLACYIGQNIIFSYLYTNYGGRLFVPIYGALLCGIFCMLGHIYPVFFQFKGGKAVALSVGVFLVVNWRAILIALAVFLLVLLICRIISVSSLSATAALFVCMALIPPATGQLWVNLVLTFIMCAVVFIKHSENIKRLIHHEEKRIF